MDYHYGSYTKSLDPYLKMVREGGLSHKLVAGRSEQLHSGNSLGERVYSMFVTSPDGQVLEYLSPHVSDPESFMLDECHFRPVKNFKHLNLTDFAFEDYDISKLGQWAVAAEPLHGRMAESVPHHTSIVSLDPDADAEYLKWLLGARIMNSSDLPNPDLCNGERAVWVHFAATGSKERSNDHYLKFVHNPNAKKYDNLTVERYINTLARENKDLANNRYSPFADDHVGLDLPSPVFAQIANKLVENKHHFLTRREPDPSAPYFWDNFQWEKFSIFVKLPGSHFLVQLQTCCVAEDYFTVPFTFCDWDFCEVRSAARVPDLARAGFSHVHHPPHPPPPRARPPAPARSQFPNYRNTSAELISDPTTCGYSAMNQSHPYNELLNKSKAIKEPDDSSQGLNFSLLDLGNTSNPHPGHGPMLAQQTVAPPAANAMAAVPLVAGVAAVVGALAFVALRRAGRRQYAELPGALP